MKQTTQFFITILTLLVLLGSSTSVTAQIQKGQDIDGKAIGDISGQAVSMPDANTVAIGATRNNDNGIYAGHVRVFAWDGDSWNQKGQDLKGEAPDNHSGGAVSMPDANTVAIGATGNDGNGSGAGHVRIYNWNGIDWTQKGMDIDGEAAEDFSGISVSMPDENTVAIGANYNDGNGIDAGHVRIYQWENNVWLQKGTDIDGEAAGDLSGRSVSMPDANTVAIGAPGNNANGEGAGHVRVYTWNGIMWIPKGLDIDGVAAGDQSGAWVSMPDPNTVAIGAPRNDGNGFQSGHVRIFMWDGSGWIQKGNDIYGESENDLLGRSVDMPDANTVAIGAPLNSNNGKWIGHVRVYTWDNANWTQKGQIIEGEVASDQAGHGVSMPDANTIAVGAPFNSGNGHWSGHVRVFTLPTVGIEENSFTDHFTIYPNPTTGQLSITFDAVQEDLSVSLFTLDGKLLENRTAKNTSNLTFEISAPAGIYLLRMSNQNQQATVRVVKE